MKGTAFILVLSLSFLAFGPSGHAFQTPLTQSAQTQSGDFDGEWVGSGHIAQPIFRAGCGNGPLIELKIQNGIAKAVFKTFAKGKAKTGLKTRVIPLSGSIDSDGKLVLSGYESAATALLLASNGTGEGTWEFRNVVCYGTFRVRRK